LADKDFKVKSGLDLGTPLPLTEGGFKITTFTAGSGSVTF
jgi:hypothetical protein